jgi:ABC-2 type transport system permease protein
MRLKASIIKEFLVLLRDIPGLIVLFIMPVAMIIVISLVQDTTIQSLKGTKINILYTDYDQDILGETLRTGLEKSELFNITDTLSDMSTLKQIVADEDFRIAVIIPKHSTNIIRKNIEPFISGLFTGEIAESDSIQSSEIIILSDPTTKENFRNSIKLALETYTAKIETQILLKLLAENLESMTGVQADLTDQPSEAVVFTELFAFEKENEITPNSTQHNVPAWTMFAMFFIVIPLAGNMIQERNDGSFFRLLTMPGSYLIVLSSKTIVYLLVTFIQFILMLLVGIFILPAMGLPVLKLGSHPLALVVMGLISGLAAIGFGILIGTIANTHEQSGVFGSVSVIILAALGGIWYPIYAMPEIMQKISIISPLNWGLNGFYEIFLKDTGFSNIVGSLIALTLFFAVTLFLSVFFEKVKRLNK